MDLDSFMVIVEHATVPGVIAFFGFLMWSDLRKVVNKIADSLETLTIQMAKIVERVDSHEKRIDKLEDK